MDDNLIIDLYWERSERAISETDIKYGKMCTALAGNILSDRQDTEECVNDTYLGLWNSIPPARPVILSAYIAKTVRNIAMKKITYNNAYKRSSNATISFHELEECLISTNSIDDEINAQETADCIECFLRSIDYESRNMFLRRYWFFDSISEIAARFAISESKVKSRLFRTRKKLNEHLVKEGIFYVK